MNTVSHRESRCEHLEADCKGSAFAFAFGCGRLLYLCPHCYYRLKGMVLEDIMQGVALEYLGKRRNKQRE